MDKHGLKALIFVGTFVLLATSCSYLSNLGVSALVPGVEAAGEAFIAEEEKILMPNIEVSPPAPTPAPEPASQPAAPHA